MRSFVGAEPPARPYEFLLLVNRPGASSALRRSSSIASLERRRSLARKMRRFDRAVFAAHDIDDLLRAILAEDISGSERPMAAILLTADARFQFRQIAFSFRLTGHVRDAALKGNIIPGSDCA